MVYGKTSWIVHPGNWNSPQNGIPNFQDWHLHVVTKLAGYPMKRARHQIRYRVQQSLSGRWFAMFCLTSFDLVELLGLMFFVVSVHQVGHEDNKLCCKCCEEHCSRGARDLRAGYFSLRLATFASCVLVGHVSFHMIDTVPNLPWKQAGNNFVWKGWYICISLVGKMRQNSKLIQIKYLNFYVYRFAWVKIGWNNVIWKVKKISHPRQHCPLLPQFVELWQYHVLGRSVVLSLCWS